MARTHTAEQTWPMVSVETADAASTCAAPPCGSAASLLPGTRIHHYELIRMLSKGGMGTVYLARDLKLGRRVAIKFLQTTRPERTWRILQEARTTARCQHDNIVVIHEVGEHEGAPYLVLEYLDGMPLAALLENGQRLPYPRAVEIACAILRALRCAHEAGIVHRDLKPDNVFVTEAGAIKVLDFGIAMVLHQPPARLVPVEARPDADDLSDRDTDGTIVGTPTYMAPEQWGIGLPIDHLADLWACGLVLHLMICGRHPLPAHQLMATSDLARPMPSMEAAALPEVPRELIEIVDRCLRKRKEERWQSADELLAALASFLPAHRAPGPPLDERPYAGLAPFQERDAGKFFGRDGEIAELVSRIRARPLSAVVGSSGIGKSSFVRAGVVPALKRSGEPWEALVLRPGRRPIEALAAAILPVVAGATPLSDEVAEQRRLAETLRREPGHLGEVLRIRARRERRRLLLFVDQLEELYTQAPDPADRAAFTACLSAVADDAASPLRVVLSIRSDFLDRVAEDRRFFGELTQGLFFLGPPGRAGLRDAIANPAEMAGFQVDPAIVEDMLAHLDASPGALPLLQFAASRLWDLRDRPRRRLAHASYAAMGGVAGALASHADRVVADLGTQRAPLVRAILLRLVTAERARAIVPLAELRALSHEPGEVQWMIDRLVDARLLVVQTCDSGAGCTVELAHESLVHGWPALRRWLDEDQGDAALVEQLRTAARQWSALGRDPGLLWRGEAADAVGKLRTRHEGPLSDVERAFLDAIVHHAVVARRRRCLLSIARVALVSLFLVGAVVLAGVFRSAAERERRLNAEITEAKQEIELQLHRAQMRELERDQAQAAKQDAEQTISRQNEELRKRARLLEENAAALEDALAQALLSREALEKRDEERRLRRLTDPLIGPRAAVQR